MAYNTANHSYDFPTTQEAGTLPASGAFYAQNFPRSYITTDCAIGATTLMTAVAIALHAGDTVTKMSYIVGATAAGTPTHQYWALYSPATIPLLLGQSTDTAGAAQAANTVITASLNTPVVIPSDGLYWVSIQQTGTTIPTLMGRVQGTVAAQNTALNTLFGNNGYCVTATGAASTAPGTLASLTNLIVQPWVLLQ